MVARVARATVPGVDIRPFALASEDGGVATDMPPPDLEVNVHKLDGFACSVVATATLTVWELKALLEPRLQIPKGDMNLIFGNDILLANESLGSVFGVTEGTVDVTLVRTPAVCSYCGSPGLMRCGGCSTYYCGRRCQRIHWFHHRRLEQFSAARTESPSSSTIG